VDNRFINAGDQLHTCPRMDKEYYKIKDKCRKGLLKYLGKAFSLIPEFHDSEILDIGCGTGVPTIWIAENFGGIITAIDNDGNALEWLNTKIIGYKLENHITTINISFFDLKTEPLRFDIILAEGFLNIIGFKEGFVRVMDLLKEGGYFVIHDEYKDHEMKCEFIREHKCDLIGTIFLDESIWWEAYYKQLSTEINSIKIRKTIDSYKADLKEIEFYMKDPSSFKSIYYLVKKNLI
jgi:cyclopropane fatty-acyl-phospholipid synthase-like methyltransferase